ncbi:hypothetical protein RJ640_014354 [Escallonia rubra]|uniref:DC1 domain-containing protein n=1 Tax=Escallonia rubra TaxID=112253 RepID=A0AA88R3V0_9ASTE|nr:hypothetical protein RJ640_014354 [Escallonia rubra]
MALARNTIMHFTHPEHSLAELTGDLEFLCDGCKTLGMGKMFICRPCNFTLHDYCGTCPSSLSSFMHPHPLTWVPQGAQGTHHNARICRVCGDHLEGFFYRCNHRDCDFKVHPLCTQLPEVLWHVLHPAHPLMLKISNRRLICPVCGYECSSWCYGCEYCRFEIHPKCVLVVRSQANQRGILSFNSPPPPQPQYQMHHNYPNQPPYPMHHNYAYQPQYPMHHNYAYQPQYPMHHNYANQPQYPMHHNYAYQPQYPMHHNYANQQAQTSGATNHGPGKMYALIANLALGVFSNVRMVVVGD